MSANRSLTTSTDIIVKFSDCDALQMVWHGNYIKYFEDGREDFGRKFNLGYWDIYQQSGLAVPLVHIACDFKKFVFLNEVVTVQSTFIDTPAAKIIFEYKIFNSKKELICTGESTQVFVHAQTKELVLVTPPFYNSWKEKIFSGA
ncbi:MAG: acyl-CoA thioesterase [Bacteroidetes bacterium]|nr:acyl-CoA thioesterase [Bacteroidota bacterium]